MKQILAIITCYLAMSFSIWQPDFEVAQKTAKAKHELILLNFSGSDWCGPCIRMHKEILNSEAFTKMADTSLVMVNADFPRKKKNQLSAAMQKQNDALAEKYNRAGKFPYTILMDENGKILKIWDGLPKENATQFTQLVKDICTAHANK